LGRKHFCRLGLKAAPNGTRPGSSSGPGDASGPPAGRGTAALSLPVDHNCQWQRDAHAGLRATRQAADCPGCRSEGGGGRPAPNQFNGAMARPGAANLNSEPQCDSLSASEPQCFTEAITSDSDGPSRLACPGRSFQRPHTGSLTVFLVTAAGAWRGARPRFGQIINFSPSQLEAPYLEPSISRCSPGLVPICTKEGNATKKESMSLPVSPSLLFRREKEEQTDPPGTAHWQ
jgi:hypothetical protein